MGAESRENLDDMFLGNVSEGVSESDEVFADRVRQAQAKMAQIRKDEKDSQQYDEILSKMIGALSPFLLNFVILCIDHEVPSLTILALISLLQSEAQKICWEVFQPHIKEPADFGGLNLVPKIEEKLSYWWTFIHGADHLSKTIKLKSLQKEVEFIKKFRQSLEQILFKFLQESGAVDFDQDLLKKKFADHQAELF